MKYVGLKAGWKLKFSWFYVGKLRNVKQTKKKRIIHDNIFSFEILSLMGILEKVHVVLRNALGNLNEIRPFYGFNWEN